MHTYSIFIYINEITDTIDEQTNTLKHNYNIE